MIFTRLSATLALFTAFQGCAVIKDKDALTVIPANDAFLEETGEFGSTSSCSLAGFVQHVAPLLRSNCMNCHGGSGPGPGAFASADDTIAFFGSKSRFNVNNPGNSSLSTRIAQGHQGFATALAGTITAALELWAPYDLGTSPACEGLGTGGEPQGPGFDDPFSDPPPGAGGAGGSGLVPINPNGLAYFTSSIVGGLRVSCGTCHVPGGQAAFATIAHADAEEAYRAAKPRALLATLLINRASTPSHCPSCGPTLAATLNPLLQTWASIENANPIPRHESADLLYALAPNGTALKTFNLSGMGAGLAGVSLEVSVNLVTFGGFSYYRLSNPTLVTPAGVLVEIGDLYPRINGVPDATYTTWRGVEVISNSTRTLLTGSTLYIPVVATGTDRIGFSIGWLSRE